MLNWALRYAPIVNLVNGQPGSVLEVGSGSHGLAHYLPRRSVVGVDLGFSGPAAPNLKRTVGSVLDLPFADHTFDVVVSSDMLEHLPPTARAGAVAEMKRVGRRLLVVAFPSGPAAEEVDRRIAKRLISRRFPVPDWLEEHFRYPYPTSEEIFAALDWAAPKLEAGNTSCRVQERVIIGEMRRGGHLLDILDNLAVVNKSAVLLNRHPFYRKLLAFDLSG
jgi:SAM-dependent methyltransferase